MLTNRWVLRSITDAFGLMLTVRLRYKETRGAEGKKEGAGTKLLVVVDEERSLGLKKSEDAMGVVSELVLIMRYLDLRISVF